MVRSNARSLKLFCLLRLRGPKQHVLWCAALKRYEIGDTQVLLKEFAFSYVYIFISSSNQICDTRNGCDFYCDGLLSGRTSVGHLLDISSPNSFQLRIGLECNCKCILIGYDKMKLFVVPKLL